MASPFDIFWGRSAEPNSTTVDPRTGMFSLTQGRSAVPGLVDMGVGLYGMTAGRREAADRLREAQGPLYDEAMAASRGALSRAGSMDPKAAAQERFNAAQGLLSGQDAASEAALWRNLQAKGMLGLSSYDPGASGVSTAGGPINPIAAAHYAARNQRNAQMSYDALNEGEGQIDRMLQRSGRLQDQAGNRQRTGLEAARTQPSRAAANMNLLKGASGILRESGMLPGVVSTGKDWLSGLFGGGNSFDLSNLSSGFDLDWGF
jgi:hypothetical protein